MRRGSYRRRDGDLDDYGLTESPRRMVDPSYTHFYNPNLDNGGGERRGANLYKGNPMGSGGKERHARYDREAEHGVPDTGRIPDRTNAEVGYMRPRGAEARGSAGPSPRKVHKYAVSKSRGYRER